MQTPISIAPSIFHTTLRSMVQKTDSVLDIGGAGVPLFDAETYTVCSTWDEGLSLCGQQTYATILAYIDATTDLAAVCATLAEQAGTQSVVVGVGLSPDAVPDDWTVFVTQSIPENTPSFFAFKTRSTITVTEPPHFSILMPSYKHAAFLPKALTSLQEQSYPHWEAVVVNDGSPDNTVEVVEGFAQQDPRIRLISQDNGGTAKALNTSLANTRYDWIGWLSSDDYFQPHKLACHVAAISAHGTDQPFHHTNYDVLRENTGQVEMAKDRDVLSTLGHTDHLIALTQKNIVNGITVMIHRSVIEAVGSFDEMHPFTQDYHLWTRILRRFPALYLPVSTSVTRVGEAQTTNQQPGRAQFEAFWAVSGFVFSLSPEDFLAQEGEAGLRKAVIGLLLASFNSGSYLARFQQNQIYLDKAVHLGQHLCPSEAAIDRVVGELECYAMLQPAKTKIVDYFTHHVRARTPYQPFDTVAYARALLAAPQTNATMKKGLTDFLVRNPSSLTYG